MIEQDYFGIDGKPIVASSWGFFKEIRTYDSRNRQIAVAYFGVDGKPIVSQYGYASATWSYDPRGQQINLMRFGVDGQPAAQH
jgi:hypothetical protein